MGQIKKTMFTAIFFVVERQICMGDSSIAKLKLETGTLT